MPLPFRTRVSTACFAGVVAAVLVLSGCSSTPATPERPTADRSSATGGGAVVPPEANAGFDYQIGGAYPPSDGVRVVVRDRRARPAAGRYSVCYVNAFQAQPEELGWWRRHHPGLLLRDPRGREVVDRDWNEVLLDLSTAARRAAVADVVGDWTDGCADAGFRAVEFDNLDSYTRSAGLLSAPDAVALAGLLVERAHRRGLAAAQKNTVELLDELPRTGFDFAVAENCARYRECGAYLEAFDGRVLAVEYGAADFRAACAGWGDRMSVVWRDVEVSTPGSPGYVRRAC